MNENEIQQERAAFDAAVEAARATIQTRDIAALRLIAQVGKFHMPNLTTVQLSSSDQGDYLQPMTFIGADGTFDGGDQWDGEDFWAAMDAASEITFASADGDDLNSYEWWTVLDAKRGLYSLNADLLLSTTRRVA